MVVAVHRARAQHRGALARLRSTYHFRSMVELPLRISSPSKSAS